MHDGWSKHGKQQDIWFHLLGSKCCISLWSYICHIGLGNSHTMGEIKLAGFNKGITDNGVTGWRCDTAKSPFHLPLNLLGLAHPRCYFLPNAVGSTVATLPACGMPMPARSQFFGSTLPWIKPASLALSVFVLVLLTSKEYCRSLFHVVADKGNILAFELHTSQVRPA